MANELRRRSSIARVLTVFVGKQYAGSSYEMYSDMLADGGRPACPDVEVASVEGMVTRFLQLQELGEPLAPPHERTVRGAVDLIFTCQGEKLLGGPAAVMVDRVVQWVLTSTEPASSSTVVVPMAPRPIQQAGPGGQYKAREVVTMCIDGDISEFDEARQLRLRKQFAILLADDMSPENIRVRPMATARKYAAKIGTGRCHIRVEVDAEGFSEFSTDEGSSSSQAGSSEESSEDRLERQIERDVEYVIRSKYWPSVEVDDITIVFTTPGSVLVVLVLLAPAAHVLLQLSRLRPTPTPLTDAGVRCCKLGDSVARLDDEPDIEKRVRSLFGNAVLAAEQTARDRLDAERETARAAREIGAATPAKARDDRFWGPHGAMAVALLTVAGLSAVALLRPRASRQIALLSE